MKALYTILLAVTTVSFPGVTHAQTWRPKHAGLPAGFSAKSVYGEGSIILVANTSGFSGDQMYYTPDTATAFAGSPSSLGSFSQMETGVVKCMGMHFVASINGVYKSHDNGHTWTAAGTSGACYALYACHDTLYASLGAGLGACEMSVDTGLTWVSIGYTGSLTTAIYKYNNILFVGSTGGIKYTPDNGATWSTVSSPSTLNGHSIVGITSLGSAVYAADDNGVFKSTDNGGTWTNVLAQSMFCLTTIDTSLFGGTNIYGVYKSNQSGGGWIQLATGLPPSGGVYQTVNYISSNDYYVIASAQGDSAIYVIDLAALGLHAASALETQSLKNPALEITVLPNPASDALTISLPPATPGIFSVSILDMTGRCVSCTKAENKATLTMSVKELATGTYILHAAQGNKIATRQITIIK